MLEYRENINYYSSTGYDIDAELAELRALLLDGVKDYELYDAIRGFIFREIKIKELAITIIIKDLEQIRQKSASAYKAIVLLLIDSTQSYLSIARQIGYCKQGAYQLFSRYRKNYVWLDNLMKIKSLEDSKNENNRTIFFNKKDGKSDGKNDGKQISIF